MLPKRIHYCWFGGGEKPQEIKDCLKTWEKFCPDYEIIEWNEKNFDFSDCKYATEAYDNKMWAFVADYARLVVLYEQGGLYMDSDLKLYKPIDRFFEEDGLLSFEADDFVCMGLIGANKGNSLIKEFIDEYKTLSFVKEDGSFDTTTNVRRMRDYLLKNGLKNNGKIQKVADFTILPQIYFFPCTFSMLFKKVPKRCYAIHYSTGAWGGGLQGRHKQGKLVTFRSYLVNKSRNILGTDNLVKLKKWIKL